MPMTVTSYSTELEFEHFTNDNTVKIVAKERGGKFRTFAYHTRSRSNVDAITSIDQEYKNHLVDKSHRGCKK